MTKTLGLYVVGGDQWMGGLLYVRNLAVCLSRLPEGEQPKVVLSGGVSDNPQVREMLALPNVRLGAQGYWLDRGVWDRRFAYLSRRIERKLLGPHADRWMRGIDAIFPALGVMGLGDREIYWVPDFQPIHLPELFDKSEIDNRLKHVAMMARSRNAIVFSSQMAARDFRSLHPDATARPHIWHFCSIMDLSEKPVDPKPKYALPVKYLYCANQFWAHKNHAQLFDALKILKERGVVIPLVCTGKLEDYRNEQYTNGLLKVIRENDLSEQIHLLGIVPREDQISVFRHAAAVVQPSRFEGWSTVIEDAKAIGRPVLASDFPVHREQLPNGKFFPLDDAESLADLLEKEWPGLSAGPDYEAEAHAAGESEKRQLEVARNFLKVLEDATGDEATAR